MTTARILIVYHSSEGHTAKVAHRIEQAARSLGVDVETKTAGDAPPPDAFDVVIAGDSIHATHHSRPLTRYLKKHAGALERVPLALFQVSLTSASDDAEHNDRAHHMVTDLADATGVDPDLVGLFAGALAYTRYGWMKRRVMARIAAGEGGDTDTSVDYDYTDWHAVDAFARDAVALVVRSDASGDAGDSPRAPRS